MLFTSDPTTNSEIFYEVSRNLQPIYPILGLKHQQKMVKMNFGISCRFCGSCTKINLFQYSFTSSVSKICNSFSSKSSHVNVVFSVTFDMVFFMLWSSFMGLILSDYVLPIDKYQTSCAVNRSSSSKLFLPQNFMNIDATTLKTFFWFLRLSAGPQKLEHKVDHNYFTV